MPLSSSTLNVPVRSISVPTFVESSWKVHGKYFKFGPVPHRFKNILILAPIQGQTLFCFPAVLFRHVPTEDEGPTSAPQKR